MMLLASRLGRTLGELAATMTGEEYGLWKAAYAAEHRAREEPEPPGDDFEQFKRMMGD